jgi:uncharacterized membrane protein YhaH (DUF805 family)
MPNNWFSLRRLFDFRGRASRREYFLFHVICFAVIILPLVLFAPVVPREGAEPAGFSSPFFFIPFGTLFTISELIMIVGLFAVAVRRLHDQGKSWWHMLFGFIPLIGWIITLVWIFTPGDEGENEFGPDPREGEIRGPSYEGVFD